MQSRFPLENNTLLYIHDPMCSWCWGYRNTLGKLKQNLPSNVNFKYIVGGLAADTNEPMPSDMKLRIQQTWQQIQKTIPGVKFNFDFWKLCSPRRSTYPACRALLVAEHYNKYEEMLLQIQKAYYLEARNPSDYETLYDLAFNIGISRDKFRTEIHSDSINSKLENELSFCRSIQIDSYPSIVFYTDGNFYPVVLDYNNFDISLDHIRSLLAL